MPTGPMSTPLADAAVCLNNGLVQTCISTIPCYTPFLSLSMSRVLGGMACRPVIVVSGQPSEIHERIPTFLGSLEDVMELESYGDVQQLGNKKYTV